jgi:hypothetical protein
MHGLANFKFMLKQPHIIVSKADISLAENIHRRLRNTEFHHPLRKNQSLDRILSHINLVLQSYLMFQ